MMEHNEGTNNDPQWKFHEAIEGFHLCTTQSPLERQTSWFEHFLQEKQFRKLPDLTLDSLHTIALAHHSKCIYLPKPGQQRLSARPSQESTSTTIVNCGDLKLVEKV